MNIDAAIALAALPLGLAGAVWAVIAGRARQTGDEPRCRACHYDLRGRDNLLQGNCPECGALLSQPNAVRRGLGGPQPFRFAAAAFMAIGFLLLSAWRGTVWARQFDWIPYEPTSWLLPAARSPRADWQALTELNRRVQSDSVREANLPAIISAALAEQKSAALWNKQWGMMLEHLRQSHRLSDRDWASYLDGVVNFKLDVRAYVYFDQPPAMSVVPTLPHRGGNILIDGSWDVTGITINGTAASDSMGNGHFQAHPGGGGFAACGPVTHQPMKILGRAHVKVDLNVAEPITPPFGDETRHTPRSLEGDFDVGPALQLSARDVELGRPYLRGKLYAYVKNAANGQRMLSMGSDPLPFRIAAKLTLRTREGAAVLHKYQYSESPLPWEQSLGLSTSDTLHWTLTLPRECPPEFDVVLTPDTETAAQVMDSSPPWPETIVITPIFGPPATQPASTQPGSMPAK